MNSDRKTIQMLVAAIGFVWCVAEMAAQRVGDSPQPVVGITGLDLPKYRNTTSRSAYFLKSYTKWLEQHNINWVPVNMYESDEELDIKLDSLSGLLLTGGGQPIHFSQSMLFGVIKVESDYASFVHVLVEKAKLINDKGRRFPVWATCLGFEGLIFSMSDRTIVTQEVINENRSLPLKIIDSPGVMRTIFAPEELEAIQNTPITFFHHKHAFVLEELEKHKKLMDEMEILATAIVPPQEQPTPIAGDDEAQEEGDEEGKKVAKKTVASKVEGTEVAAFIKFKKYPFVACSFHPEKVQFELNPANNVPRSEIAIIVNRKYGRLFRNFLAPEATPVPPSDYDVMRKLLRSQSPLGPSSEAFVFLPDLKPKPLAKKTLWQRVSAHISEALG